MEFVLFLLVGFVLGVIMSGAIIPRILIISLRKRLFDSPDIRKVHHKPVSRLGGFSFFPTILFAITLLIGICSVTHWLALEKLTDDWTQILLMSAGLTLLFIIGIADDLIGVRYRQKFFIQVISASMFPLAGLYINDFYGLFSIHELPVFISIPFTLLLVIFITNAINLIDGIDGLASGLSMVALFVFGTLSVMDERWISALLAFTTIGVLLPFFYYNVFGNVDRGRKIFMGDTGSLTLGFILSFLTIQYTMNTYEAGISYKGAILIAFSALLVPCLDVIRVVIGRVRRRKNPFMPDKTHIHHKFLAMGFTPRKAMISILCISFLFCISNVVLVSYMNNTLLFVCDVVVWTLMNLYMDRVIVRRRTL